MSTNVTKVVYRFPIDQLKGATQAEALAYFREQIGEPSDCDEYDGVVEGFYYDLPNGKGEYPFEDWVKPVHEGPDWGVEVVLGYSQDGMGKGLDSSVVYGKGISTKGYDAEFLALGFLQEDIANAKVHAYTWYNGVDEPVTFD